LAKANSKIASVKLGLEEGFELDEVEKAEEKGCADADSDQNDPTRCCLLFCGFGLRVFLVRWGGTGESGFLLGAFLL
jgi:hypothetical protein